MKTHFSFCLALALLLGAPLQTLAQDAEQDRAAIVEAIETYATGADTQDAELTGRVLHPKSMHYVPTPEGLRAIDQEGYLELLRGKQIGGIPRTLTVEAVDLTEGHMAAAKIRLTHERATFLQNVGLLKLDGTWQIISILTLVGAPEE